MRAKPGRRGARSVPEHHGDEFDQVAPEGGVLTVNPVREFTPKVPQSFDDFVEEVVGSTIINQMGPVFEDAEPVVTDGKSAASYLAAFDKRSNSQPDDDDDCSPEFQRLFKQLWDSLPQSDEWDVDDATVERWLNKLDAPKQARMKKALDELFDCEDDHRYLGEKTLSVKVEALLKRYDGKWAPRLIYAGNDHFNALTGPVAMVLCEKLKELTDRHKIGPIKFKFAYKAQNTELASHLAEGREKGYIHCAEADFSANDLRQRKFVTKACDIAYAKLGVPSWARKLCVDMRKFHVKNHTHGHSADLQNQLPTGTTFTTPRNTIWNCSIEAIYAIVTRNEGVADVLGDDFLSMLKRRINSEHWENWVAEHAKMKLTAATPELQGEATFLSRRLCVDRDVPVMVPKLGKALGRFNARASSNLSISDSQYMAGKALCYAYEFRYVPTLRELFLMRFRAEDSAHVEVGEISYYTRINGVDSVEGLLSAISATTDCLSEDETREFLMDCYGDQFGLVACREISQRIILSTDVSVVTCPDGLSSDL